jgi:hypothetical protein
MTLRDYFAAAAMPALIPIAQEEGWIPSMLAEAAYDYADDMMRRRGQ